ncbi:MAG: hypothetical protein ACXWJ4_04865 [Methyloceanibacter sp.]
MTMRKYLNVKTIEALRPAPAGTRYIKKDAVPGFGVRVPVA